MRIRRENGLLVSVMLMSASIIQCGALRYFISLAGEQPVPYATAYLDPSTGAMIISAIIGIFATLALGLKTFWYKVASLFKRKDSTAGKNTDGASRG